MDPDGIASRILLFLGIFVLGVFGQGGSVSTTAANFRLTSDALSEGTHDGQSASARGEIKQISSSVSTADSLLDTSPLPRSSDSTNAPSTQVPTTTTTNAPSTQAPTPTTTNAPSTQAPTTTTTNAPSTQAPTTTTTNAPSTQAPTTTTTNAPSTQAPSTTTANAPSTQAQSTTTTNAPSTQAPSTTTTNAPSTQAPSTTTTNAPSTQAPSITTTTTALITQTSTISSVITTSTRMTSPTSSSGAFSPTTTQSDTLRIPTTAGGVVGENGDDGGGGLGIGLTAGLIVIVLTLVIFLSSIVVCFFCYVRRGRKEMEKEREIQRRARKSASDNGHVTHANYAFSSDDAEKASDVTPTRPSDVPPPAVAPPTFSIFTTSDAKTTEEERMRTMSKKAKEAIEAGQTPPAVRAMRLLRESQNTSLKTRAEAPVGTQQSGTHTAGVDDLNLNHMNHHITGDDDGESDFDYGDLKLDLTGLRDPTDNSDSYHVAPTNKALHGHSSDSSEFEFDEDGKTGESARRRKQTHHKGPASSDPQHGYTVSSDADNITPPKPDVKSSPNAQGYGLQPLGTPSRMRKAESIPDRVLSDSEGPDENNASRSSKLPPISGVTAPLVSHANSSKRATDLQPMKHKSSNDRPSESYLKSVLATPTRTRKKDTGAVKTPLDIFATPNLNRKSVNLEKESRDSTLEPTGRSGSYLDLSARALKKDEEKRRGSISKPPVGTVDAKPTSKPDKQKEAHKSHDSAKKEAVEFVSKYEKKLTTEEDDDSLARRREKHRQRYRSKPERPDSEDRHEKHRPEVSSEPSLSQSDRTKPDPDSRRRSHSRSRKYDDGPSQPDARRDHTERSRRSSRANTDEQERDVSESRLSQTGSDRPERSKHRETRSKSDDVRKSRSSHKTDDETREKRGASNQRRNLSEEDSKQQLRDTETSDERSRSRRHRHRESRDSSHRQRKRSDSTERPLASDEADDKRSKVASDMNTSTNHAETHDKRRHSRSAKDNSSSEHHKRKHHRENATDEKLSRDSTSKDRHRHRNRKRDGKEETREEVEARRERRRRRKERAEAKKSAPDVPKARVVMVGNSQSDDDDDSSDSDDVDPSTPNPTTAMEMTLDDLVASSMEV